MGNQVVQLPPPLVVAHAREEIRRALTERRTRIAVIDDDPTGSQVIAQAPVIANWATADIDWAITEAETAFVVLTNSRSVDARHAEEMNYEIGLRLAERGRALDVDVRCISRSDSTLRGHFPGEVNALVDGLRAGGQRVDGVLLCPAFLQAGRLTIDDVHYIRADGQLTPVAETEFARDSTFGYRSSNLREWAVERGVDPALIHSLSLVTTRIDGPMGVARVVRANRGGVTIANVADEADLDVLILGLIEAERGGVRLVYRTGPSFVGARSGQHLSEPLTTAAIAPLSGPGLLVVGSHTALTTRQLERARLDHSFEIVELRVDQLDGTRREIEACSRALNDALTRGDAALVTSRHTVTTHAVAENLALGRLVANALVDVVRSIPATQELGWIVAKGGITSSDVATRALEARRAEVLGQVFPGLVSVWRLEATSRRCGVPYVVFPGNVGDDDALSATLRRLRSQ